MSYQWSEEIEDASDYMSPDSFYDVCWNIAYRDLVNDGADPNDPEFSDKVTEEASNFISVWRVRLNSALYSLLQQWYGKIGQDMEQAIRSYYEPGDGYFYFVTGCGYDIMSADLLGGSADGIARRDFDSFVREVGI